MVALVKAEVNTMDKPKKYTLPEDSAAYAAESLGTYNVTNRQIVLTIPQNTDADVVRNRVDQFYTQLLDEIAEEQKFYRLFEEWWEKTCLYSGPGLCYKNEAFRKIYQMGTKALRWIDQLKKTSPDYMSRHIEWLRSTLLHEAPERYEIST